MKEHTIDYQTIAKEANLILQAKKQLTDDQYVKRLEDFARHLAHNAGAPTRTMEDILNERTQELVQTNEELNSTIEELKSVNEQLQSEIEMRKHLEQELSDSEERFRSFIEQSVNSVAIISPELKVIVWNKSFEQITGIKSHEAIGKYSWQIDSMIANYNRQPNTPDSKQKQEVKTLLNKVLSGTHLETEVIINNPKGEMRYVNLKIFPIKTKSSIYISKIAIDITKEKLMNLELVKHKKQLEQLVNQRTNELKESETRQKTLIEIMQEGMVVLDQDMRINTVNPSFCRIVGQSQDKLHGQKMNKFISEKSQQCWQKITIQTNFPDQATCDISFRHEDGTVTHTMVAPSRIDHPNLKGTLLVFTDITSRKKAENALNEAKAFLEAMFEQSAVPMVAAMQPDKKLRTINHAAKHFFGIPDSIDYTSFTYSDFPHTWRTFDEDNKEVQVENLPLARSLRGETIQNIPYRIVRTDGIEKWYIAGSAAIRNKQGEIIGGIVAFPDITAQKENEKNLFENKQKYQALIDNLPVGVFEKDRHFRYKIMNRSFKALFDINKVSIENKSDRDIFPDEIANVIRRSDKKTAQKLTKITDENVFTIGHDKIYVISKRIPLFDANGDFDGILGIYVDETQREQNQQKLLNTIIETEEKERRRFAEDLHDDLGPFLSGIMLYINELGHDDMDKIQHDEIINYMKETVNEAIKRTREISNNLMPSILFDYGLAYAIESFVEKIAVTKQITIHFKKENLLKRYSRTIEIVVYRIAIELINNSLKHSKAENIYLFLYGSPNSIGLEYSDDGIGFSLEKTLENNKGMGLHNILNRLQSVKGSYTFDNNLKKGFQIKIRIDI